MRVSNTLGVLALAERVVRIGEFSRETRIVLPRAAVEVPGIVSAVSAAYAALAV
jgi:hypothetical protein